MLHPWTGRRPSDFDPGGRGQGLVVTSGQELATAGSAERKLPSGHVDLARFRRPLDRPLLGTAGRMRDVGGRVDRDGLPLPESSQCLLLSMMILGGLSHEVVKVKPLAD